MADQTSLTVRYQVTYHAWSEGAVTYQVRYSESTLTCSKILFYAKFFRAQRDVSCVVLWCHSGLRLRVPTLCVMLVIVVREAVDAVNDQKHSPNMDDSCMFSI